MIPDEKNEEVHPITVEELDTLILRIQALMPRMDDGGRGWHVFRHGSWLFVVYDEADPIQALLVRNFLWISGKRHGPLWLRAHWWRASDPEYQRSDHRATPLEMMFPEEYRIWMAALDFLESRRASEFPIRA